MKAALFFPDDPESQVEVGSRGEDEAGLLVALNVATGQEVVLPAVGESGARGGGLHVERAGQVEDEHEAVGERRVVDHRRTRRLS